MLSNEGIKVLFAAYQEFPGGTMPKMIKENNSGPPGSGDMFVPSVDWNIYHRKIPAQHLMYR